MPDCACLPFGRSWAPSFALLADGHDESCQIENPHLALRSREATVERQFAHSRSTGRARAFSAYQVAFQQPELFCQAGHTRVPMQACHEDRRGPCKTAEHVYRNVLSNVTCLTETVGSYALGHCEDVLKLSGNDCYLLNWLLP